MLRHNGWSALATATLVGSALAVCVQAFPRQPDRKTEAGGTSPGGHIPARAGGAGAAEVQPIAEHPEQRLTAREQEFWGTLQTTLRQSEDRCTALERELHAVPRQLGSRLALSPAVITAEGAPSGAGAEGFPALPLPRDVEGLIGMPQTYTAARSRYLGLITSEAEQRGLPAALADAVAQAESRYDPKAVGSLGEVGLMQIRPRTAALLGLSTLANPGSSTPAVDVEAVLSTLPLPPDIDPPTFASAAPLEEVFAARSSRKKLVLGKPVADGHLQSGFGMRRHPILGFSRMHTGVDWVTRIGAPILSAGDGAVIKAEWAVGYGLRVEIQHADGVVTTYSHMSRFGSDIAPGTEVRQGQVIGFLGSTGLSTGPHLHYEVMVNGQFVDPMEIYVPEGASVAAKVEKTTLPADEQAAIIPAERIAAAPTQHQTQVEPVPLPPIRLASLGTTQAAPKAPEAKALVKASVQAAASVTTAPRSNQPNTWRLLPLRQVSLTKAQLVRVAEPQPGILPDTRQALAPELNANGSPVQNLAKVQAAERGVVTPAAFEAVTLSDAQEVRQIAPVSNWPSVPAKSPQLAFAASLGIAEPSKDHPQVHPKSPETRASPSKENTARMQRAAPQGLSAPHSQTDARPQPPLSARAAGGEVVKPAELRSGTPPDAQEAKAAPEKNPGGVPTRAPQLTPAATPPSPAAHRLGPATSNKVTLLGTTKVRPEDQAHAAPMPAIAQAQPAGAPDLATTAAKQAQLGLVPLPPVRLASLGTAESKGDPEQAFSKVTAMKEISSDENAPGMRRARHPRFLLHPGMRMLVHSRNHPIH